MSRATLDDQLKFLLSCVKHSNNGRVDFVEVAKECGVVSKGAAAKRYERLAKANGISQNGAPDGHSPSPKPPTASKRRSGDGITKPTRSKKRKNQRDGTTAATEREEDGPKLAGPSILPNNDNVTAMAQALDQPFQPTMFDQMSMPPPLATSTFFPRPLQGYRLPVQGHPVSYLGVPPAGQSMRAHVPGDMQGQPPFAYALRDPFGRPVMERKDHLPNFDGFAAAGYFPHQHMHQLMQPSCQNRTLPSMVPPPPQEVEPARQLTEGPASLTDENIGQKGAIVVVE